MKEKALSIEHLNFQYDSALALEDVHLDIFEGEFVGIFGPNGGGKTTLLKLILGLLEPMTGKVLLFGKPPEEMRHLIGYVPQAIRLDRDFPISVLEVVMMGALRKLNWLGRYPKDVKRRALDALEQVGLSHKAQSSFGTLSGGEAQRTLIARAIIDTPRLLVLDEPTANIDPEGEQSILEKLRELNKTMTILMVTHDLQTIVDKVGKLLCVQRKVTCLKAKEVCEHFALGLYHTPLTSKNHFSI
ncbi:MAG: ABC transporter ATP-binding protein [Verrucomicrobia bacterium]|nr:ABC transporter ATP-binding protein [Verrucomicrobiota bacterium]